MNKYLQKQKINCYLYMLFQRRRGVVVLSVLTIVSEINNYYICLVNTF